MRWRTASCLAPACRGTRCKKDQVAVGGVCQGLAAGWAVDAESAMVTYHQGGQGTGVSRCLRPTEPPKVPAACVVNQSIIVGKCPVDVHVGIKLAGDRLVSSACAKQDLCVLGPAGAAGGVALGDCSSALASGWGLHAT